MKSERGNSRCVETHVNASPQSKRKSHTDDIMKPPSDDVMKSPSDDIMKSPSDDVMKSPSDDADLSNETDI